MCKQKRTASGNVARFACEKFWEEVGRQQTAEGSAQAEMA